MYAEWSDYLYRATSLDVLSGCCCCGTGIGGTGAAAALLDDGRSIYTLNGIITLPDACASLKLLTVPEDRDSLLSRCPPILVTLLAKRGAADDFNALVSMLVGKSVNGLSTALLSSISGIADLPDHCSYELLALVEFTPRFAVHGIELFLKEGQKADCLLEPSWFIFVDRQRQAQYIPPLTLNIKRKSTKGVKRLLRRKESLELVVTPPLTCPPNTSSAFPLPSEEKEAAAPSVDLSGSWLLASSKGDLDAELKEMGYGWAFRNTAAAADYGAGRVVLNINQSGNDVEIESIGMSTYKQTLCVGAGVQDSICLHDGTPAEVLPRWVDGGHTLLVSGAAKDGRSLPTARRSLKNNTLVVESTMNEGSIQTCREFHCKQ